VQEIQHCLSIWGLVEHGFGDPILDKYVTVPHDCTVLDGK